jgi:peroxiredoxin
VTSRKTFLIDEKGVLVHVIDSVDINTHATDIITLFDNIKKT